MRIGVCLSKWNETWLEAFNQLAESNSDHEFVISIREPEVLFDVDLLMTNYLASLKVLNQFKNLKTLMISFTGINNMPLDYLQEKKITLVNCHAHAKFVAEKAVALGFSLLQNIPNISEAFKTGWNHNIDTSWTSFNQLKCGILGMGEIGQNIIQYLKSFNSEFITLKRYEKRLVDLNVKLVDTIETLCLESDIIFSSLPLTEMTRDLVNEELLMKMKDKYIVNVGRGEVFNEKGLYHALSEGILKGAALDVWYQYPPNQYPSQFQFHKLENVIMSPHCAANTKNSHRAVINDIILNLKGYLAGESLKNIVDFTKKY